MLITRKTLAVATVALLGLSACSAGSGGDKTGTDKPSEAAATTVKESAATEPATSESSAMSEDSTAVGSTDASGTMVAPKAAAGDITINMITHSDDGVFWSVVKRGAQDAADQLGVTLVWQGSNNDPTKQVQFIEQAISEGTSGIAASLPSPDQLVGPLQKAVKAGIPVVTINSGVDQYQEIGAITHVGQTEFIAGQGAGKRFNELGVKKVLCGTQEQSNVGLEERCKGVADTFEGEVVTNFMGPDADTAGQQATISSAMQADPDIDAFMGCGPVIALSGLRAAQDLGRDIKIGAFDNSDPITEGIQKGEIAFTVDQQQYLQGYLAVQFLYLNVTNSNTVGGGQPVLTGPGFVDSSNVEAISKLVAAGTR